jgi:hypothetical protein
LRKELLHLDEFHIGLLGTFLALGIGAGSSAPVGCRAITSNWLGAGGFHRDGDLPGVGRALFALLYVHLYLAGFAGIFRRAFCGSLTPRCSKKAAKKKGAADRDQHFHEHDRHLSRRRRGIGYLRIRSASPRIASFC